ncbi:MAG: efflux RND transporter periplasmic adaptor subunit [Flavobacteriaceae bacterium]|nr:efflux RND transporter periplasmic adaptor subunit [Flavobacteriaceae bacterium]
MKKYKNYIIGAGILILGIILGNIFSGGNSEVTTKNGEHEYVQDPVSKIWTCSMHPQIRMDKPGDCPICGMELIPLEGTSNTSENIASNEIVMTEEAIQLANIQTSIVTKSNANKEIRLLGRVKPDERRLYSQVSHIPGRIERLYINFTGEKVYQGQKIVRLYSPDLVTAQKELFEAIRSKDIYPQLYTATRNKLKLWKLTDKQIDAIEKSGVVNEQVDIYSDYSGYVMKRNVELGDHIMAGGNLFDIANLNTVWVMFEAYESDIPWIHINDEVEFTIQAIPGKTYKGKVTYVDPFVSSNTRVAKVRVELKNPSNKLLPEMYATGIIKASLTNVKDAIMIPKSAALWTGKRAVVYVKVPHEKIISFVYREIILGEDLGDFYIVKNGLKEGEIIATNGVFRIDASAQLLGQKSMMNPEGGKVSTGGHEGMDMDGDNESDLKNTENEDMSNMVMIDKSKIDKKFKQQIGKVVTEYIKLKDAFTDDNTTLAQKEARNVKNSLENVDMLLLLGDSHNVWMKALKPIKEAATKIQNSKEIGTQRNAFLILSKNLSDVINTLGIETENGQALYLEFCSMADNNKGGFWLSYDKEIKNPFFGKAMLTCGEVKATY